MILLVLIILHTVDGREIDVNPSQITSLRETHDADDPKRPFTGSVRCMVNTADGKFITVIEECAAIRELLK